MELEQNNTILKKLNNLSTRMPTTQYLMDKTDHKL